jgi:tRNA pseudouridine55 synthase
VGLPKEYTGTIRLGVVTTTDDLTGEPLSSTAWESVTQAAIVYAMRSLIGRTAQRPPRFSAKIVGSQRAYRRARRGEDFELEPRLVDVDRFDLVALRGQDLDFRTSVASGVYVRSLARDVGARLGCGAHLVSLRRTAIGLFQVADATSLDQVVAGSADLRPAREAVAHLRRMQIGESERVSVRHGRAIPSTACEPGPVALLAEGELVAVAESDGNVLRPSVVLES